MPYPIHSFEHYYNELIWRVTPSELLDVAIQKGVDVAEIFNAVRHEDLKIKEIVTYFQYEWQLLILGGVDFDLESQQADFFMQKDNQGKTPAHYFALSKNLQALNWIKMNSADLLEMKDKTGRSIAHYAAWSGHRDTLDWIHEQYPALLIEKDDNGMTVAHWVAESGQRETLYWIETKYPALLREKTTNACTIAHLAAESSCPEALDWIKNNCPSLLSNKDDKGNTVAHWAMKQGHFDTLDWIQNNENSLINEKNNIGLTIAHLAIDSEHTEKFTWIQMNSSELISKKDNSDRTIAHIAAKLGHVEVLGQIKTYYPQLLTEKDYKNRNIAHFAAYYGRVDIINYLLQECPSLLKTLWVRDKNGNTPHAIAKKDMAAKPNQLRDNELLAATNRQLAGQPKLNDTALLCAFQEEWREILLKREGYNLLSLVSSAPQFPQALRGDIMTLIPTLELMAFSFDEGVITRAKLQELLRLASNAIPPRRAAFFVDPGPVLVQQLQTFSAKLSSEALTREQIFCLQRIVQDYEQRLLDEGILVTDILTKKLLASATLGNLRPKVEITTGMDIRVENFPAYFKTFAERVALLPLNNDEAKTMSEIVLPGIETIIRDEEIIVRHVTTHEAKIYFLNGNMPLHTDHAPTADANAYRQTLRHLLINLFGAIEIAHNKGRLSEFCGKLSSGHCLEGRVRDAFTWVVTLTEIVSFDDLMHRYIHQEYVPYMEVMFDVSIEDIVSDSTICNFIMARHKGMPCLVNPTYAPTGEITESGVNKYLTEILGYTLPETPLSC